jgi:ABC-type protease/lipase transport system fused ATPase/permease subunit
MLCRIATLFDAGLQGSIHSALATLPLRGVKPVLLQQPLRDLDQVRTFMSGMGPTAFLDMPWIPVFLIGLFLFHPLIGLTALLGTAAIIAMTLVTERISRGATKSAMDLNAQRQVLADATQRNAEIVRALGMTDRLTARWSQANEGTCRKTSARPTSMPISVRPRRCCATSCNRECWASVPISSSPTRRQAAS